MDKIEHVKTQIKNICNLKNVSMFPSGTSAFSNILDHIKDEFRLGCILIPEFCCERVLLPIIKLKISYAVLKQKTFLKYDLNEIKKLHNGKKKLKAILIVYNYGYVPENLLEILKWAKNENVIVIEDIASCFGLSFLGHKLGTLGDYTFGSFGHDKFCSVGELGFNSIACSDNFKLLKRKNYFLNIKYNDVIKILRKIPFFFVRKSLLFFLAKFFNKFSYNYPISENSFFLLFNKLKAYDFEVRIRKENTDLYCSNLSNLLIPNNDNGVCLRVIMTAQTFVTKNYLIKNLHSNNIWAGDDFALNINSWIIQGYQPFVFGIFLITNPKNTANIKKSIELIKLFFSKIQ